MKKILLFVAFISLVFSASAWNKNVDAGAVVLATKYLTPEAKGVVEKYLGTVYEDDVDFLYFLERKKKATHTKEIHFLHLDKNYQPLNVEGDDALKSIEAALEIVRTRDSHSDAEVKKALRYVINLMLDIHNFSNVRIENIEHSQADFELRRQRSDYKSTEFVSYKWSRIWNQLSARQGIFHAELMAEDMELCHGDKFAEFTKGNLHDWAADNGARAAEQLAVMYPNSEITLRYFNLMEYFNYDMITRAGMRLAKLLNETIK